jgi:transcriptional antiterminator
MLVKQSELAEIFGVSTRTIHYKTKDGKIPHVKKDGSPVKYVLAEAMKAYYGEDWNYYYNKYIDQKINELESYRED